MFDLNIILLILAVVYIIFVIQPCKTLSIYRIQAFLLGIFAFGVILNAIYSALNFNISYLILSLLVLGVLKRELTRLLNLLDKKK